MRTLIGVLVFCMLVPAGAHAQKAASLTAADYEEIRALYSKYVYGYDTGDATLVASVLAPDATLVIGGRTLGDSRDEIIAGIKPRVGVSGTRHIPTNILIEPSPEGATGMQYLMLMSFQDGKMPAVTSGGIYRDAIVKTAEGWRFKKREVTWFSAPPAVSTTSQR
jgi:hypothetical protein